MIIIHLVVGFQQTGKSTLVKWLAENKHKARYLTLDDAVDRKRSPGKFLFTGSANVMLLPRIAESLVGRMEVLTLWPFSQSEIESPPVAGCIIDRLFARKFTAPRITKDTKDRLIDRVLVGGFPEAFQRTTAQRRGFGVRRNRCSCAANSSNTA